MKTAVEVMETVFKAHEELRRFRGDVMAFGNEANEALDAQRKSGYDAGVKAERERCLSLMRMNGRRMPWGLVVDDDDVERAIADGLTVEELEAKLREVR